jgi:tetratricopeptide (TPR) repeat protein
MVSTHQRLFEQCIQLLNRAQYQDAAVLANELVERAGKKKQLLEALDVQAEVRRNQGRYEQAIDSLKQRQTLAEELVDGETYAWSAVGLGRLYMLLGRYELALEVLTEASAREMNAHPRIALLGELASVFARVEAFKEAETLCAVAGALISDDYSKSAETLGPDAWRREDERKLLVAQLAEAQGQFHRAIYTLGRC